MEPRNNKDNINIILIIPCVELITEPVVDTDEPGLVNELVLINEPGVLRMSRC